MSVELALFYSDRRDIRSRTQIFVEKAQHFRIKQWQGTHYFRIYSVITPNTNIQLQSENFGLIRSTCTAVKDQQFPERSWKHCRRIGSLNFIKRPTPMSILVFLLTLNSFPVKNYILLSRKTKPLHAHTIIFIRLLGII